MPAWAGCLTLAITLAPAPADRIRDDQWHLKALRISEAHRHSRGDGVTVAVIDTGVAPHIDLRDNLLLGTDIMRGERGNGQGDTDSHGTSMGGLIAAHGHGDAGALGIAPRAKILPVRAAAKDVQDNGDAVAAGIDWAILHGVTVINVSNTGGPSARLRAAVEAAIREDVVVVAGVGNRPQLRSVGFPAAIEGVLAVGATDRDGNHADLSVTGERVMISAPGVDIYSTSTGNNYSRGSGTSAATAIVSGAVALVRSRYPDLSAPEVIRRLTATAVDKGPPGRDPEYGYGVLDVVAALTADAPPPSATAAPPPASPDLDGGGGLRTALALAGLGALATLAALLLVRLRRRRS